MVGRQSFAELRARSSTEISSAAEVSAPMRIDAEMHLGELRRAMKLSQLEIGQKLQINQGSVAKIEKRADVYVSTLRRFIEAMGGELEIIARFQDHSVKIKNYINPSEESNV